MNKSVTRCQCRQLSWVSTTSTECDNLYKSI